MRRFWRTLANPVCLTCGGAFGRHDLGVLHGDGTTDDTAALMAMLRRADGWYGDRLRRMRLPDGTYRLRMTASLVQS